MTGYIAELRKVVGHKTVMQCGASVICVDEAGRILLGKRSDNHQWGYAGGSLELDECAEACAKRELYEEMGIRAERLELFCINSGPETHYVYPNGDEVSNVEIVFLCKSWQGEPRAMDGEIEALRFFFPNEIRPEELSPPIRGVFRKLLAQPEAWLPEAEAGERTIRELYRQLYRACRSSAHFFRDAHFVSMRGVFYPKNEKRLLLIGRAPNGWESLLTENEELFAADASRRFADTHRFSWIESVEGTLYSNHDRNHLRCDRYCVDASPFWYYAKEIWQALPGTVTETEIWQENIAWTNLYKVSPRQNDNPGEESRAQQLPVCVQLLRKELEAYRPTHILLLTGFDWFAPFASVFDEVRDFGERNVMRGAQQNRVYVEGTARWGSTPVVIACRPERRKKENFVRAVLQAFEQA